ncbi:MAG: ribulose-5-phosphate 4-epimerase-like epimerase or aldolase [Chloroflexi bacterium]|nr:ribulose-5-phosphate 4-epimerase-like epimerase or aldolase [Chloroflexota bacterium]
MANGDVARLREQVVQCTRLLMMEQVIDFSGHVSVRLPGTDHILIQPRDTSRAALTADDLLLVDLDGQLLEGEGPAPSETALHTSVYRARPDVSAVCHGHPPVSTLFTIADRPLVPVRNFAYRFAEMPVHPDTTHIRSRDQGDAVARTLASNDACLLRAHGTVVVGKSIAELFVACIDVEENARSLLYATALGPLLPLQRDEIAQLAESYGRADYRAGKVWEHFLTKGRHAGVL